MFIYYHSGLIAPINSPLFNLDAHVVTKKQGGKASPHFNDRFPF